jgi:heterodisulfide reductase subunit A
MTAVKNALIIKETKPDTDVHILYRDMQMYGTEKEKMLWNARGKGIRFHVYDEDKPPEVNKGRVHLYQPLLNEVREIPCDLVVLSTPLIPDGDVRNLARLLRVPVDQNGFFWKPTPSCVPSILPRTAFFYAGVPAIPQPVWRPGPRESVRLPGRQAFYSRKN